MSQEDLIKAKVAFAELGKMLLLGLSKEKIDAQRVVLQDICTRNKVTLEGLSRMVLAG